jgi:hypothetical protein
LREVEGRDWRIDTRSLLLLNTLPCKKSTNLFYILHIYLYTMVIGLGKGGRKELLEGLYCTVCILYSIHLLYGGPIYHE